MDKQSKIEKFEKFDKMGVKGDRLDKINKVEPKLVKSLRSEKTEKIDKINKFTDKMEKSDKLEKSEQLTTKKRRKLFRLKTNKKDNITILPSPKEKVDKQAMKDLHEEVVMRNSIEKDMARDCIYEGPRELLRDTLKSFHKRESKDGRKNTKSSGEYAKHFHAELNREIMKGNLRNSLKEEKILRKNSLKNESKISAKEFSKLVQKELLKSNTPRETMRDKDTVKETLRDPYKDSSKESSYKTACRDPYKEGYSKSSKEAPRRDLREIMKGLDPRKDNQKISAVKDLNQYQLMEASKNLGRDSSKDSSKDKESLPSPQNNKDLPCPNRSNKVSISKATALMTNSYFNNIDHTTHSINLCVASLNSTMNSGKCNLKASPLNHAQDVVKDSLNLRNFCNDLDIEEEPEKDDRKVCCEPLKNSNIQTTNGLTVVTKTFPHPPSNLPSTNLSHPPHMKRKEHLLPPSTKLPHLDSARNKNNELQRFFDPIKELCISIPEINDMFNIHQLIGYGAFSTVLLATLKRENKVPFEKRAKFAVKHLSPNNSPKRIKREMQFMTKIGGTNNVVKLHCCSRHNESVAFVMPYLECDHFKYYFRLMDPAEVQLYMQNLLVALRHVHKYNVIHRDVKPGNFLYNRVQRKFMLVDFGLAEEVIDLSSEDSFFSERDQEVKKHASRAGTRGFRPPEVLLRFMNQTTAVDIWAAGVIFLSILSKVYPPFKPPNDQWAMKEIIGIFGDKQIIKVAKKLRCAAPATESCKPLDLRKICVHFRNLCKNPAVNRSCDYRTVDYADKKCKNCRQSLCNCLCVTPKTPSPDVNLALDIYPASTYDLLSKLLEVSPFERITAEEALKHPFFKERFTRTETNHNNFYMPIRGSLMQILRKS